jgi:serine/threonine protein kinase
VLSEEYLSGITRAGFTQTMMGPGSSSQTGTQMYMAPELFAGKPASIRSDIYSLGVVLYQLLVGDFTRPVATEHRAQVEEFRRKHRIGLLTLVFTDIVGSTALKQGLGDPEAATLFQDYRALVRSQRAQYSESEEIETAGDSFLLVFARPSEAVEFAWILQTQLESWSLARGIPLSQRVGGWSADAHIRVTVVGKTASHGCGLGC